MSNPTSKAIHKSPRLLKAQHDVRPKWRDQIEQGWLQAQRGEFVDGDVAFDRLEARTKERGPRLR